MNASGENDKDLDLVQWLAKMLSTNGCPGLRMKANDLGKFTIPWLNEKCGGLRPGADDTVFIQAWAKHKNYTSKFGDEVKDLREWKSHFRNSLNSWVKRRQNIMRLKDEDYKGFMVCQFEKNFLKNNFTSLQAYDEPETRSGRVTVDLQIDSQIDPQIDPQTTLHMEVTSELSRQNEVHELNEDPMIPLLEISVRYGIPHSEVKTITLTNKNPACRLFYPSCSSPAVQQYLGNERNLLQINLPPVEFLPEFSANQKKSIESILEELDRGIYLFYHADDIYVERRCQTKTFVDSHILQNETLPRRATRNDDPKFVKVFDYQRYRSHLSQCESTQNSHDVRFTFGENTVLYQQFCMSHIQVIVTHVQALKDMNTILNRNGSDVQIKSSQSDDLDRLIEVLDTACCNDGGVSADDTVIHVLQAASILEKKQLFADHQTTPVVGPTYTINSNKPALPHAEDNSMMIEVFCGRPSRLVNKTYVSHSQHRCRIFSGPAEIQMSCDNFGATNDARISLPSKVDATEKDAEKINTILSKLIRGIHVKYDNGDIFVERRCGVNIYLTDGCAFSTLIHRRAFSETEQEKYIPVFDCKEFQKSVIQFQQMPSGKMPSHEIKLTVGHEIKPDSRSPMTNVLMHVSICHLPALQHLYQTFGNPVEGFNPLLSNPDSIDRILKIVKDLAK